MRVLVINIGSSSLKFQVIDAPQSQANGTTGTGLVRIKGTIKDIGENSSLELTIDGKSQPVQIQTGSDHEAAIQWMIELLQNKEQFSGKENWLESVEAVGHRFVHGGKQFLQSTLIDSRVMSELEPLNELAPLHNTFCFRGIRSIQHILGETIPMVAVFDTAFHSTLPPEARTYALPYQLAENHGIQRYGFHGIAHASLAQGYAHCSGKRLESSRIITVQLGNGCSVAAIANGRSVDTSMGFTPLEGLVMGTRSGDVDPGIISYLHNHGSMTSQDVNSLLYNQSGLLGISGQTQNMQELLRAVAKTGDPRAKLAIEVFCYRAKKYLGAYLAVLGGADAVVFGGGIGENAPEIRAKICERMEWCGLKLDPHQNAKAIGVEPGSGICISEEKSPLTAFVVGTDEETLIAQETVNCLQARKRTREATEHVT